MTARVKAYIDPGSPMAIARRGIGIVFPGSDRMHFRKQMIARLPTNGCGAWLFVAIYRDIEQLIGPPEHLPPRMRLALIRLSVRLVSRGREDRCMCSQCKEWRKVPKSGDIQHG